MAARISRPPGQEVPPPPAVGQGGEAREPALWRLTRLNWRGEIARQAFEGSLKNQRQEGRVSDEPLMLPAHPSMKSHLGSRIQVCTQVTPDLGNSF